MELLIPSTWTVPFQRLGLTERFISRRPTSELGVGEVWNLDILPSLVLSGCQLASPLLSITFHPEWWNERYSVSATVPVLVCFSSFLQGYHRTVISGDLSMAYTCSLGGNSLVLWPVQVAGTRGEAGRSRDRETDASGCHIHHSVIVRSPWPSTRFQSLFLCHGFAEIILFHSVFPWVRASLGDFSLAPACPIEKIPLEECLVYLTLGSENDEGVPKTNVKLETPRVQGSVRHLPSHRFTERRSLNWKS